MKKILLLSLLVGLGLAVWSYRINRDLEQTRTANRVEAYYQFVTRHQERVWYPTAADSVAEAAELASTLVEQGHGLSAWPAFLKTLGALEGGDALRERNLQILLKYLRYPLAEIRRGAMAGLLSMAQHLGPTLSARDEFLSSVAGAAAGDLDPEVRADARSFLWQLGKLGPVKDMREPSAYVAERVTAYQRTHPSGNR